MATTPVSSALPAQSSFHNIRPQVWFKWAVSQPMAQLLFGVIAAVVLYTLYRIVTRSKPSEASSPAPLRNRATLCFIRINPECISDLSTVQKVQVIIKDTQENNLAVRNLPHFDLLGEDISALLPLDTPLRVYLKITRDNTEQLSAPFRFKVENQPHLYSLYPSKIDSKKIHLVGRGTWKPPQESMDYPNIKGVSVDLSEESSEIVADAEPGVIRLKNPSGNYMAVQITLCHRYAPHITLLYPLLHPGPKFLNFKQLIQDYKAEWSLQNHNREFSPGLSDDQLCFMFRIESIAYESYRQQAK